MIQVKITFSVVRGRFFLSPAGETFETVLGSKEVAQDDIIADIFSVTRETLDDYASGPKNDCVGVNFRFDDARKKAMIKKTGRIAFLNGIHLKRILSIT